MTTAPLDESIDAPPAEQKPRRTLATALSGMLGAAGGIAPHVLHHVGPLVGTALVAGATGTVIFGVASFVASVPMLLRLRRRFGSWWAPAIAMVAFTAMFLVSSLVLGPLITGTVDEPVTTEVPAHDDAHHE